MRNLSDSEQGELKDKLTQYQQQRQKQMRGNGVRKLRLIAIIIGCTLFVAIILSFASPAENFYQVNANIYLVNKLGNLLLAGEPQQVGNELQIPVYHAAFPGSQLLSCPSKAAHRRPGGCAVQRSRPCCSRRCPSGCQMGASSVDGIRLGRRWQVGPHRGGGRQRRYWLDPETGVTPEDQRDRYTAYGRWAGKPVKRYFHLLRNTGTAGRPEFTYVSQIKLPTPPPGGPLSPVDPNDPTAGLLLLNSYGDVFHLPLLEASRTPRWGRPAELFSLHGAPFSRLANFISITVAALDESGRVDLFAGDLSSNVCWCRYYGRDDEGRPVYANPRKIKQREPHVNGGNVSVPTVGDWRGTGTADLLVGSMEGYIFWYKTLSTNPLRFAPPERVRVGDEEMRRYGKPNPSAGYHWGSSQGPNDGFNGGYSNPVLVDWDGNGKLDLLLGVGPQFGSAFKSGYVLLCHNVGTRAAPVFKRPEVLLFNAEGKPLEFWRHAAHPALVDWDGDGKWEILVGADMGFIWYFKPKYFGAASGPFDVFRPDGDTSL